MDWASKTTKLLQVIPQPSKTLCSGRDTYRPAYKPYRTLKRRALGHYSSPDQISNPNHPSDEKECPKSMAPSIFINWTYFWPSPTLVCFSYLLKTFERKLAIILQLGGNTNTPQTRRQERKMTGKFRASLCLTKGPHQPWQIQSDVLNSQRRASICLKEHPDSTKQNRRT